MKVANGSLVLINHWKPCDGPTYTFNLLGGFWSNGNFGITIFNFQLQWIAFDFLQRPWKWTEA